MDEELFTRLGEWDTPALSNALDALHLRASDVGHTDGSVVRVTGNGRVVGRAVTATMTAREGGPEGIPVARLHQLVGSVEGPVIVVMEDLDDPAGVGAFLGEVNGTLLDALGIRAFVTNGRVRDVDELRTMAYPVYATGLCVARASMRLVSVGEPVCVAGMSVATGDLVHGDEHGLLQIPVESIPAIFDKADLIRDEEQRIVQWARSDEFTLDGLLALKRIRH